jgi:uncharacterized protein YdbL (DUF1318 family)
MCKGEKMRLIKWLGSSFATLMLISCVTINIYFPAAAAEKAADRIIEDVWGPEVTPNEAPEDKKQSNAVDSTIKKSMAMDILDWLIAPAQAEPNLNINSPVISGLQAKMKQRHEQLKAHYQTGAIGLTDDGLVAVRDLKLVALKDRNGVKSGVADENSDRLALYAEIARANGHPEWKADIQSTFSRRWIDNASKGWWFQSAGSWQQK